jgi:hypothetical protein
MRRWLKSRSAALWVKAITVSYFLLKAAQFINLPCTAEAGGAAGIDDAARTAQAAMTIIFALTTH